MTDRSTLLPRQNEAGIASRKRNPYSPARLTALPPVETISKLVRGAQSGNPDAAYMLASIHQLGLGVPKDPEQASYWLAYAAQLGHAVAEQKLVEMSASSGSEPLTE